MYYYRYTVTVGYSVRYSHVYTVTVGHSVMYYQMHTVMYRPRKDAVHVKVTLGSVRTPHHVTVIQCTGHSLSNTVSDKVTHRSTLPRGPHHCGYSVLTDFRTAALEGTAEGSSHRRDHVPHS